MIEFQEAVRSWVIFCFGKDIADDTVERNYRFLEESIELVQACGMSKDKVLLLVDYVFDRPVGEKNQEVGGVMITLSALCSAQRIALKEAAYKELHRIYEKIEIIRDKQKQKPRLLSVKGEQL